MLFLFFHKYNIKSSSWLALIYLYYQIMKVMINSLLLRRYSTHIYPNREFFIAKSFIFYTLLSKRFHDKVISIYLQFFSQLKSYFSSTIITRLRVQVHNLCTEHRTRVYIAQLQDLAYNISQKIWCQWGWSNNLELNYRRAQILHTIRKRTFCRPCVVIICYLLPQNDVNLPLPLFWW